MEVVLEHVRRVARERATGLTLDSSIIEIGLASLERMEIIASLEDEFGGRFPESILFSSYNYVCRQRRGGVHVGIKRVPLALSGLPR